MVKRAAAPSESGYTLVALAIAVSIMAIMVAAAMPMWSTVSKRQKEEELIFRGWQYAEAIRVFQQRHGRLPTRLEELEKVKPRSIRRLWKDPMTDDGEWGVVFQGQQQDAGRELAPGGLPGQGQGLDDGRRDRPERRPGRPGRPGEGGRRTVGPIVGVHSASTDESIKVLFGERQYDRWIFTVDKLSSGGEPLRGIGPEGVQRGSGPIRAHSTGGIPVLPKARWIGRPFREGLIPEGGPPAQAPDNQGR